MLSLQGILNVFLVVCLPLATWLFDSVNNYIYGTCTNLHVLVYLEVEVPIFLFVFLIVIFLFRKGNIVFRFLFQIWEITSGMQTWLAFFDPLKACLKGFFIFSVAIKLNDLVLLCLRHLFFKSWFW